MTILYNLTEKTAYLLETKKMNVNFKSDAFLYLAFIVVGFTSVAATIWEKLACIVVAVGILVLRSFMKKKLYK